MKIKISNVDIPGWVWIAGALLATYLAKRFITDSFLVEIILTVAFMVLKWQNITPSEVKEFTKAMDSLFNHIYFLEGKLIDKDNPDSERTMRSSTESVKVKTVDVSYNPWIKWMVG